MPDQKSFSERLAALDLKAEEIERVRDLESAAARLHSRARRRTFESKTPLIMQGFERTSEGWETAPTSSEFVALALSLPARQVAWDLEDASYRLEIELERPGVITARTPEARAVFTNRRVVGVGVLDLSQGRIILQASEPIIRLNLVRFSDRALGELIIGPIEGLSGFVTAEVTGHGDFTCELAYDYAVPGSLVVGTTGVVELAPPTTKKEALFGAGVPYSVARLVTDTDEPRWADQIILGKTYGESESVVFAMSPTPNSPLASEKADYWGGLHAWRPFLPPESPQHATRPGVWTHLWGRVEEDPNGVVLRAYALDTGQEVSPGDTRANGRWLLYREDDVWSDETHLTRSATARAVRDDTLVMSGVWCATGEPYRYEDDELVLPGEPVLSVRAGRVIMPTNNAVACPYEERPTALLIRIRGRGLARAVTLTAETRADNPGADPVTTTHREQLSHYLRPDDQSGSERSVSGPALGTFRPV